jgi:hypothetical protein|nr:hypothetical protein [uncultured Caldimonas sp.]
MFSIEGRSAAGFGGNAGPVGTFGAEDGCHPGTRMPGTLFSLLLTLAFTAKLQGITRSQRAFNRWQSSAMA